jgi:hypothetical protein
VLSIRAQRLLLQGHAQTKLSTLFLCIVFEFQVVLLALTVNKRSHARVAVLTAHGYIAVHGNLAVAPGIAEATHGVEAITSDQVISGERTKRQVG